LRVFNGNAVASFSLSTHSADILRDDGIALDEVLLLEPAREGTTVRLASEPAEAESLLQGVPGQLTIAEVVMPRTRPAKAEQLPLFPDF